MNKYMYLLFKRNIQLLLTLALFTLLACEEIQTVPEETIQIVSEPALLALSSTEDAPPAAPTGLTATEKTATTVTLTWNAVEGADRYWIIKDGKKIGRTPITSYTVYNVTPNTEHTLQVRAWKNKVKSNTSEAVTVITPALPVPTGFTAQAGSQEVVLNWTASSSTEITGYKIRRIANGVVETVIDVPDRTTNVYTVTGLTPEKSYSFTISAAAAIFESAPSEAVTVTTNAVPEAAITGLTVTGKTDTSITLTWDAITHNASYKIYKDGVFAMNTNSTTETLTDLSPRTNYTFTVSAYLYHSRSREGELTATSEALTVRTNPPLLSAPTGLTATEQTPVSLWLEWDYNLLADYYLVYKDGKQVDLTYSAVQYIGDLTPNTSYSFMVTATNGIESEPSVLTVTTPALPAPADLTVQAGIRQATLTWTPSSTEKVTGYKIRQTLLYDNSMKTIDVTGKTTSTYTVTDLNVRSTYSFTITALIENTESPKSEAVTVTTPALPVPTGLTATEQTPVSLLLAWDNVPDTEYYLVYKDGKQVNLTYSTVQYIGDLAPNTSYSFTVTGTNGIESEPSEVLTVTTPALPAPADLTVQAGIRQATLAWTPSAHSLVTGYKIRQTLLYNPYDNSIKTIDVTGKTTSTHTVTGLTAGNTYSFTITALIGNAEGTQSEAVNVSPTASPPPPAPTDLTAKYKTATTVLLEWRSTFDLAANYNNIYYQIYQDGKVIENIYDIFYYTVTGLTPNTSYSFTVKRYAYDYIIKQWVPSEASEAVTVTATDTPPLTGLTASSKTGTSVRLTWDQISLYSYGGKWNNATFSIYKDGTKVGDSYGFPFYTVTGLTPNTSYSFMIKLYVYQHDTEVHSETSEAITVTTPSN